MDSKKVVVLEKTVKKKPKIKQTLQNDWRKYHSTKKLDLKYSALVPLYDLWQQYYRGLQQTDCCADERLLKADLHGCLLLVTKADNKTQIGISGIVVRESRNTFLMINAKDKMITIPKQGSVFQFVLDSQVYTIFGDAFKQTPAARIQKKIKTVSIPYLLK